MEPDAPASTASGMDAVIASLVASSSNVAESVEVLHIVIGMAPQPPATAESGHRLIEDLGYDSLRLIELSVALEERFGVRFDPETAVRIRTLEDVTSYVEALAAELDPPASS